MLAPVKRESDSSIPKLNRETTRMRHLKPLVQLTRSQHFELLNLSDNNIQQSISQTSFQSLQLNSASQQTQTIKNSVSNSTQSEDILVRTAFTDTDTNDTGWEADKHDANVFKLKHGENDKNDEYYTKRMEIFHSPEFKQSVSASSRLMFSVLQDIQARQMINRTKNSKSAVTVSSGFVQLESNLIEKFSYEKLSSVGKTRNRPTLMVSYKKITLIWDIFNPQQHLAVLKTAENVTSSAVSEDLSVFVTGTSCGSLAFYKIEDKTEKARMESSPEEEIPLVPCKTIQTEEKSEILGIRLITNSSKILSISKSGMINQYNFDKANNTISLFSAQNCCVNFVTQVCQCVDSFLVLCDNTVVKSFSGSGSLLKTIDCKSEVSVIQSISPHMQGRSLLVNSENSDLLLYNLNTVCFDEQNKQMFVEKVPFFEKYYRTIGFKLISLYTCE